ncbi:MAG TPA: hypothetical protein VHO06_20275 [Polyangia bacterium]|nr:hypothetical protein [Polyangia bacterium]
MREEGASALERALLEAGSSYRSSPAARAKTLAALGVAGSATLLAGAAQAAPLGTLAKLTWGKLLAAVSLAGAVAAVPSYYAWQRHQAATRATAQRVAVARAADPEASPPWMQVRNGQQAQATRRSVAGLDFHDLPASTGGDGVETRSTRSSPHAAATATLARELSTLDAARGMLARGDAAGALARLDAYARRYPHGHLGLEAEVLRIDALDAGGRPEAAHARAEAFLQRHPHSVLAARVRAHLGD